MLYDDYQEQGFVPLAINLWESWTIIKNYTRAYSYPSLRDGGAAWNLYNINGSIPVNYVIDTAGIVVGRMTGFVEGTLRGWIEANLTGVSEGPQVPPPALALVGSSPANSRSAVRFSLPKAGPVSLRVYSSSGALVRTVFAGTLAAGSNTLNWNLVDNGGRPVANGLYVYELVSGSDIALTKVSVLR